MLQVSTISSFTEIMNLGPPLRTGNPSTVTFNTRDGVSAWAQAWNQNTISNVALDLGAGLNESYAGFWQLNTFKAARSVGTSRPSSSRTLTAGTTTAS